MIVTLYLLVELNVRHILLELSKTKQRNYCLMEGSSVGNCYTGLADVRSHSIRIVNRLETICDMCGI